MDSRDGAIKIALKFESELGVPSTLMPSMVRPDEIKRSEFDLDGMIVKSLKEKPNQKINDMLAVFRKTWSGFTYTMVKKALQRLEHKKVVELEGRSWKVDTYHLVGEQEDFDYQGMKLHRSEKEIFKLLANNPKLSYSEISSQRGISVSQVRTIVIGLREKGAFADITRFPRDYVPEGSVKSIFENYEDPSEDVFKTYVLEHPRQSRVQIAKGLNIHEGQARRLLKTCGFVRPGSRGTWRQT
jgi:hypothetical protein